MALLYPKLLYYMPMECQKCFVPENHLLKYTVCPLFFICLFSLYKYNDVSVSTVCASTCFSAINTDKMHLMDVVFVCTVYANTCISVIHTAVFCLTHLDSIEPIIKNLHFMNHNHIFTFCSSYRTVIQNVNKCLLKYKSYGFSLCMYSFVNQSHTSNYLNWFKSLGNDKQVIQPASQIYQERNKRHFPMK